MDTITKTERWNALADAIANHATTPVETYDATMRKLEDAVDNLPMRFGDRAQLWGWLIEEESSAQNDSEGIRMMTDEVKSFVGIHRRRAEAREEDVFAPEFDGDAFGARVKGAAK